MSRTQLSDLQINFFQCLQKRCSPHFQFAKTKNTFLLEIHHIPNAINTLNIKLNVIHQCGLGKIQNVSNYNQEINASISEFIDNLDAYIEWCDFVICRCGAGTLSEISQKKRGMIMIPLPTSIDNHQYFNAVFYEEKNQGRIFQEKDSLDSLSYLLRKIIHEKIYQDWKKKEPPIDHSRATSLMLNEIHKDNAAI